MPPSLVVVCGLRAEAKIAAGPGIEVLAGGGDRGRLQSDIQQALASGGVRALLSFGVAGGLSPRYGAGDILVAETVVGPDGHRHAPDAAWSARLAQRLSAPRAIFAGVDAPVVDPAAKAALGRAENAAAVDMESHIVAAAAERAGLPFAAVRVVTDSVARPLPHAASVGMRADGKVDLAAILVSLMKNPAQVPALIRTGLDARKAFAALLRCRQLLGPGFAFLDLG